MIYPLAAQQSLTNFYLSVQQRNPALAHIMSDDIRQIALYGLAGDRDKAYASVIRVQEQTWSLPSVFQRILTHALEDLGYSLLDVERHRHGDLA